MRGRVPPARVAVKEPTERQDGLWVLVHTAQAGRCMKGGKRRRSETRSYKRSKGRGYWKLEAKCARVKCHTTQAAGDMLRMRERRYSTSRKRREARGERTHLASRNRGHTSFADALRNGRSQAGVRRPSTYAGKPTDSKRAASTEPTQEQKKQWNATTKEETAGIETKWRMIGIKVGGERWKEEDCAYSRWFLGCGTVTRVERSCPCHRCQWNGRL